MMDLCKIALVAWLLLIVLSIVGGCLLMRCEQRGALYVSHDGVNVYICDGVLKTHGEKTMHHAFYCDNGTIVENLVNFTIKEPTK